MERTLPVSCVSSGVTRRGALCADLTVYSYGDSKTVFNMINRDTSLNPQQKDRQRDNMREVLRFCNNKTDCRRSQVLAFFNETFDPVNCHQGCDVCLGRDENQFTVKDVTIDAQNAIRMIQAFDSRDKITILNAVDCFRGTNGSNKGLDSNPHFGVGKDWSRDDAQRLITTLVIEGGLGEKYLENGAGWSNAYLRVSWVAGVPWPWASDRTVWLTHCSLVLRQISTSATARF